MVIRQQLAAAGGGCFASPTGNSASAAEATAQNALAGISAAVSSGLINSHFSEAEFRRSFAVSKNGDVSIKIDSYAEQIAQILADFIRKELMQAGVKISFETVFSHRSKIEFMQAALAAGYKIYLYFVSTESPEINVHRIKKIRVPCGGHDVPEDRIRTRYCKSMDLLYAAAQLCYRAYFFDNSEEPPSSRYFAYLNPPAKSRKRELIEKERIPNWFVKYYQLKQNQVR